MAKGHLTGSFSHLLYTLGKAIRFAPETAFAPPRTEQERKERGKPFLAYRLKIKNALAKMCEQSFFLGLYNAFLRSFFTTRVRSFGVLFFSCGFLQILSYFLSGYLPFAAGDESNLIFGVTLIFLTLLCSFTRGDVKDILKKSFLYRGILVPLFGARGWEFPTGRGGDNFFGMLLIGALLAFFTVIFSPFAVFLVILLLVLIHFVFYQPEAGLIIVALALFSVPFRVTAFLTAFTLIALLCKCAVGKRVLVWSSWDGVVFLLLLPLLFSEKSRLLCLVLVSLYLLSLSLLRTLAAIGRFLCALTLGGIFCSMMVVMRFVFTTFFEELFFRFPNLDELFFLSAGEQTLAPIAIVCPLALGLLRSVKRSMGVVLTPPIFLVFLAAVFCGASVPVWIALIIALAVQNLMTYRFAMVWYVIVGFFLIISLNVVPPAWLKPVFDVFGFFEHTGEGVLLVLGVGNVLGIFILTVLLACFVFAVIRFALNSTRPQSFPRVLGAVGAAVTFIVLGFGSVAIDERTLVLFILLLGLPRVSLICAKREEIRLPY